MHFAHHFIHHLSVYKRQCLHLTWTKEAICDAVCGHMNIIHVIEMGELETGQVYTTQNFEAFRTRQELDQT